ncbi:phosphoribosylaminoimidazole carboxylase, pure protein [Halogeometricum borinquense DSM 11551]|uniref:N5-carboxyaminoimidazole ribonucleotide mutase n=2 Tax=Halogeometricum borinquense TaxID=60847 RepID=E4NPP2_HALBP|nr:5-(carboxyamino)imidazole ribonucleotide mutase [Halogeometricum borinquense]ADQ67712.1 phosphoribosylaminoimidazole carboxylase, PurE protein [Halogeometricum borinquense DSM 11551]ELY23607.1 phosphoribosylaminoimidazole carboxylase, pure protein [Halogeometricum borinquense DSM 11551]RYJ13345.1 5-(carboxyamino)imidazole ribonucleotide mutase [Halogeometricum borinquense]
MTADTDDVTVESLIDRLRAEADADADPETTPDVGIIMGSDSDLDVMCGAHEALDELGFEEQTDFTDAPDARFTYETYVVSAHRTPDLMYAYGQTAMDRGLDVIIAGAGGKSADLPNMTASIAYPLPVVGVPVQEKSVDSVIGMPTGAPIVAVDAGKSFNAALSAVQMLAREHDVLEDRLLEYHESLTGGVARDSRDLHDMGLTEYVESRKE